jgi:hypothetical protein
LLTKWGTISSCNEQFLVLADIFEAATILLPLTIFFYREDCCSKNGGGVTILQAICFKIIMILNKRK